MDKLAHILDAARALSPEDRRRLIAELDLLDTSEAPAEETPKPYDALLALSGTVHSDFADLSSNKYPHVAR